MPLYGIKNCDTMKKARTWLAGHGLDYVFHDYKVAGIIVRRLQRWCSEAGSKVLVDRSGTTFRKLPDASKASLDCHQSHWVDAAQPSLIRRPGAEEPDN